MKAVIQRVTRARVKTGKKESAIGKGFLVLVAATHTDTQEDGEYLAKKIAALRIMADREGKMNKSLTDLDGELLVISQFTLYARTRKGNRPSFIDAAEPKKAKTIYEAFLSTLEEHDMRVKTGSFGEYMLVSLVNDGPVTIIIDSKDREKPRQ